MEFTKQTLSEFTENLASSSPTPGGGGACALVGAVGIALGDMVGELTVGKKKYAAVEKEIRQLMQSAQDLRKRFLDCIEKDAAGFAPLASAYSIPRNDPSRETVMEECLLQAAQTPMEMIDLCIEALQLLESFRIKGSRLALSDAATGAMLCYGAMAGAAMNVKVNTALMKNRTRANDIDSVVNTKLEKWMPFAESIYQKIATEVSYE